MKNLLLLSLSLVSSIAFGQIAAELRIYHRLGTDSYSWNTEVQNNLGQSFKISRLEYYLTRFSVVHDGGQITAISDDTVALIKANDWFSAVQLGELNVTDVEAVKFHIGVFAPVNNADPSLYPPEHPLAPKNPSMHWGWASGYRFLAYEGTAGTNFAQTVQLHALGNHNYFETTVATGAQISNGKLVIALDGDYLEGMYNIHLSDGVIAHGVDEEDLDALLNFKDRVFSERTGELGLNDLDQPVVTVYPNPSNTGILKVTSDQTFDEIVVNDLNGKMIERIEVSSLNVGKVDLGSQKGVYLIEIRSNNRVLGRSKIVLY
jgi:hypothetical protein